jgi:hypothetical protein
MSESLYKVDELIKLLSPNKELKGKEYQKILNSTGLIDSLCVNGSIIFALLDLPDMNYQYVSQSVKNILGYNPSDFLNKGVNFVFSLYHPDILLTQKAVHSEAIKFIKSVNPKDRLNYKITYDVKIKHSSGNYIRLLQRNRILKFDKEGNPLLMFSVISDITGYCDENKQKLVISKFEKGKETVVFAKDFYPVYENGILTRREIEIWKMISDDFSSKDIAGRLKISLNTVLTHRKRIKKKLKSLAT